jgi:hypothetical protein
MESRRAEGIEFARKHGAIRTAQVIRYTTFCYGQIMRTALEELGFPEFLGLLVVSQNLLWMHEACDKLGTHLTPAQMEELHLALADMMPDSWLYPTWRNHGKFWQGAVRSRLFQRILKQVDRTVAATILRWEDVRTNLNPDEHAQLAALVG